MDFKQETATQLDKSISESLFSKSGAEQKAHNLSVTTLGLQKEETESSKGKLTQENIRKILYNLKKKKNIFKVRSLISLDFLN
jgi:hypothetical protein